MPIREHPATGTILMCDFNGFVEPEMVKKRPVVVLSPKIAARAQLCTVVALSMTAPHNELPFHCKIDIDPPLPQPLQSLGLWVKGDMIYSVSFQRLDLIRTGHRLDGKRSYYYKVLPHEDMKRIRACVLKGLGLTTLTSHLA
jgi:uncharacterized protein YifN (PemK superfamily)